MISTKTLSERPALRSLDTTSNDWSAFCMTLSYEDKVQLYELRQNGESINSLSEKFSIVKAYIKYMFRLIDRYGIGIV